ncbi:MAG: hypothetical protein IKT43_04200, partial [Clostridia bacterium]|nr:hypothetical protein [Clostridia bacterium]
IPFTRFGLIYASALQGSDRDYRHYRPRRMGQETRYNLCFAEELEPLVARQLLAECEWQEVRVENSFGRKDAFSG